MMEYLVNKSYSQSDSLMIVELVQIVRVDFFESLAKNWVGKIKMDSFVARFFHDDQKLH